MFNHPFKPIWNFLVETIVTIIAVVCIGILARSVQGSTTPLTPYYLSGAIALAILTGRWIERWRHGK